MDETVYLLLEGGIVQPISHVTANYTPSDVVVFDGETYRDDPVEVLGVQHQNDTSPYYAPGNDLGPGGIGLYSGHPGALNATPTGAPVSYASDLITHTSPRHKAKQATLWSFSRTIGGQAAFTHVVWAHQVIATGSHPPFRIGMTPTVVA
jgi:hypothetical protein